MYNTARLVLAFVNSAVSRGAVAANYAEATGFLWDKTRVCGARVRDRIRGEEFDIRAQAGAECGRPVGRLSLAGGRALWRRIGADIFRATPASS